MKLTGLRTANRPALAAFSYDLGTMTATWRFETAGWQLGDHYLLSLSDAVTDVEGNQLDGEWTNPISLFTVNAAVSEFPSGDGTAGGNFNFVFTILPGDVNLNSWVQSGDIGDFWSHQYSDDDDWLFTDCDWDGDGIVDSPDEDLFYANLGIDLQNLALHGDLNGDWLVDDLDAAILWDNRVLANPTLAQGDLNGDGAINLQDLDLMFAQFGLELSVVA